MSQSTLKTKKCSEVERVFSKKQASSLLMALLMMPSAMAQPDTTQVACAPSNPEIRAMALGIVSCMGEVPHKMNTPIPTVKVPSKNFPSILQEMQNQNARFLLPGSPVPLNARVIFQLEAADSGLSQTVYFI